MNQEQKIQFIKWAIEHQPILPNRKLKEIKITTTTIPAGTPHTVVSLRNAIFTNDKALRIELNTDYPLQQLHYNDGIWTTNSLQELYQMAQPLQSSTGNTLIGGLGLGTYTHLHTQWHHTPNTTIEINPNIIKLTQPHISKNATIIHNDLLHYLTQIKPNQYDSAYFDIWQPTGERIWVRYIVPIRRLCRGKIPQNKIHCWAEQEIIGQLLLNPSLTRALYLEEQHATHYQPHWVMHKIGRKLNLPTEKNPADTLNHQPTPETTNILTHFINNVGTDTWEQEFGELWDSYPHKCTP